MVIDCANCRKCNYPLSRDEILEGISICRRCRNSTGDLIPMCAICNTPLDVDSWLMGAEICCNCRQDIDEEIS